MYADSHRLYKISLRPTPQNSAAHRNDVVYIECINMASNYDNSAWFYDRLSRVIYGRALIRSQVYLLPCIPAGATILIAGGGTGWILEEIANIYPSGLKIVYAEISAKMMAFSRKRNAGNNEVIFINLPVENIQL